MGSRIGYRIKDKDGVSHILRKQWATSIKEAVEKTWSNLSLGKPVDYGGCALRHDLDRGRAFACLVYSIYEPPFQSIEEDTNCDISNNGLIEIDISNYKRWVIYHFEIGNLSELRKKHRGNIPQNEEIDWGKVGKRTKIAQMDSRGFSWIVKQSTLNSLGEGLF